MSEGKHHQGGALELRGLKVVFGDVTAVAGVDMSIDKGEFVCLLGPSGCGKTSILRTIAGFLTPAAGSVVVNGRELSAPGRVVRPEDRGMSMVFQNYALWPHMTVFKNVAYGLRIQRVPAPEIRQRVMSMLEVVRLAAFADRYPSELSGGQQQRVALARALVVQPDVLLMDEPLSNLDASLREDMRFEIRRLQTEFGVTAIYVTHDLEEAMVVADRIAVMNSGQIEQFGSPQDIYEAPASAFVAGFVGQTNMFAAAGVASDLVKLPGGLTLGVAGDTPPIEPDAALTIAIRPHDVKVWPAAAPGPGTTNQCRGTVVEVYYFGRSWEVMVAVDSTDLVLRVSAPPDQRFRVGDPVLLHLPPEKCRLVPGTAAKG